jgi:hypothetical protein
MENAMITKKYTFNHSTWRYDVLEIETLENGNKRQISKTYLDFYVGKTNIPNITKPKIKKRKYLNLINNYRGKE